MSSFNYSKGLTILACTLLVSASWVSCGKENNVYTIQGRLVYYCDPSINMVGPLLVYHGANSVGNFGYLITDAAGNFTYTYEHVHPGVIRIFDQGLEMYVTVRIPSETDIQDLYLVGPDFHYDVEIINIGNNLDKDEWVTTLDRLGRPRIFHGPINRGDSITLPFQFLYRSYYNLQYGKFSYIVSTRLEDTILVVYPVINPCETPVTVRIAL